MVWKELMEKLIEATRDWMLASKAAEEHRKKWVELNERKEVAWEKMVDVRNTLLSAVETEANGDDE